jgi:4-diphosphocytidyl-2C-methyl-D-erythritol kinase
MTLISSANHIGSDIEFILRNRSYKMNNTGPRIDPLGIPYFNAPPSEKKIFSCST